MLRSWGKSIPESCLLCGTKVKSLEHLFFACDFSKEVWLSFFSRASVTPPLLFTDILRWFISPTSNPKQNTICKLLLHTTTYELWKEKNSKLHNSSSKPSNQVIKDIQQTLRCKLDFLDHKISNEISNIRQDAISFLFPWFESYHHSLNNGYDKRLSSMVKPSLSRLIGLFNIMKVLFVFLLLDVTVFLENKLCNTVTMMV